ncbi:MAG: hypothetical protein KZQ83_12480 [gamma proteobacterium symbiont of Taylorina sp.]|nr:hypothetical protein [gamma proteobacterium symbiont of Taylorina sp.]
MAVIRGEDEGAGKTGYREVPVSIRIMIELHKIRDISVNKYDFRQCTMRY